MATDDNDLKVGMDGKMSADSDAEAEKSTGPEVNNLTPPPDDLPEKETSEPEPVQEPEEPELAVKAAPGEESPQPANTDQPSEPEQPSKEEAPAHEAPAAAAVGAAALKDAQADTKPAADKKPQKQAPHKEHRNNKKLAAIVTVMVAISLALVAVYVFVSTENNTETADNTTVVDPNADKLVDDESAQPEEQLPLPEEIDQTNQEIDEALQAIDELGDFSEDSLSDESLGL